MAEAKEILEAKTFVKKVSKILFKQYLKLQKLLDENNKGKSPPKKILQKWESMLVNQNPCPCVIVTRFLNKNSERLEIFEYLTYEEACKVAGTCKTFNKWKTNAISRHLCAKSVSLSKAKVKSYARLNAALRTLTSSPEYCKLEVHQYPNLKLN